MTTCTKIHRLDHDFVANFPADGWRATRK